MITKLIAYYTAFMILLGSFGLIGERRIPDAVSENELLSIGGIIEKKPIADEIFAVDIGGYTYAEKMTATALQGLVAKVNPCIYLISNGMDRTYLSQIEESGTRVSFVKYSLLELIEKFRSYIADSGYILYRESEYAEGLNVATNYATAYGWLPVEESVEQSAKDCGLTLKKDISKDEYSFDYQKSQWNDLRGYFTKGLVIHEKYSMYGLRDLAIQQGAFCFYTDSTDSGVAFLREILHWSGENTYILGWVEDEKHFVSDISQLGCYISAADFCLNNSLLCSVDTQIPEADSSEPVAHTDSDKHYVTLVFSDGDNCQWVQNGFGAYYRTVGSYPELTVSWTLSPFLYEFNPLALKTVYSKANANQSFISGPSGVGYCNLISFASDALDLMSTRTASMMLKSNQRIVTVLDNYTLLDDAKLAYRLGYFSRFDNIDGGILFLDGNSYQNGKGKVWFSDGKPFASVRLSLWAEGGYDGATDEWIQAQADKVNSYPVDIRSADGYSVICVHAWSITPASLQKFVSMLDSHVCVLNTDDFLRTMQENLSHKNSTPDEFYYGNSSVGC